MQRDKLWRWTENGLTDEDWKIGTKEELEAALASGRITDADRFWSEEFFPDQVYTRATYVSSQISFDPAVKDFAAHRLPRLTTVLSGPNNSGKSFLLKHLYLEFGENAYLVQCSRFYHVHHLSGTSVLNTRNFYSNFFQQFHTTSQNNEHNSITLDQIILNASDLQRKQLLKLCEEMLGNKFTVKKVYEDNDLGPRYIDMDGESVTYGSTGTRLLMTLLGICLNPRFEIVLIDEPELGLSPRIQRMLARFFFDSKLRSEYFPHLKHLVLATHSHLFLDSDITNNHLVSKSNKKVMISPVRSMSEFHDLQFNMLGNDLESLFLPSAIVFVEGDTDYDYISRLIRLHLPDKRITVVRSGRAQGDGAIPDKIDTLKEALGDIEHSPYKGRIVVVLDQTNTVSRRVERQGIPKDNIWVWKRNGIEYYYARRILSEIFLCNPTVFDSDWVGSETVEINGIRRTKKHLCDEVIEKLTVESELVSDMQEFIDHLRGITDL